jgi:hypothetical protein
LRRFVREHGLFGGLIGAVLGALIIAAATLIASSNGSSRSGSSHGGSSSSTTTSSTSTETTKTPLPPTKPVFLSTLVEQGEAGQDQARAGEIQLGGREMPDSVFYEKIEGESVAQSCKGEMYNCRATTYELKGRYSSLVGTFGLMETENYGPQAHWQVLVDNRMERQGKIQAGGTVALDIPLHHGNTLELRFVLEGDFNAPTTTVVWGDAQLEP